MSEPDGLVASLKRAASALAAADVGFALAGGGAAYARGAAPPVHDVDFLVCPEDVEAAAGALATAGLTIVDPPEGWLVKAFDGPHMVDLIFRLNGRPVSPDLLKRAEEMEVAAVWMPVMNATDLVVSWLRAMGEHHADFAGALTLVRPLREQPDWDAVRAEAGDLPFAAAFLLLLERLGIIEPGREPA